MDCTDCQHCMTIRRGPFCERRCDFTGAAVCSEDLHEELTCPLRLRTFSGDARQVAATVMVVAQQRGMLDTLLGHYRPQEQDALRALLSAYRLHPRRARCPVRGLRRLGPPAGGTASASGHHKACGNMTTRP